MLVICIIIYYYISSTKEIYNYDEFSSITDEKEDDEKEDKGTNDNTIIVHITGAVQNEGIVEVKENARINDVIEAAGGLAENASLENVNLAYMIEDGQKIYIPYEFEGNEEIDDGEIIKDNAGDNVIDNEKTEGGLININTASQEKLQELPGIGSSTAAKIITYRTENGKFKSIEDIKNVSGIGESKYETIKAYICV